jgi:putative ABC transport system permease protein
LFGLLFIFLVWPLSNLPSPSGFPFPGYMAVFVLFVGFSLLSPYLLSKVGECSGPLLRRIGKEPAYLAAMYIKDSGPRTAISAGALITAAALFCALVIMVHSFRQTVELWAYNTVSGDIFVRAKMADVNQYKDPIPEETVSFLQNLTDPVEIDVYRRLYLIYENQLFQFEALDWDVYLKFGRFFWLEGDRSEGINRLKKGEGVLVSEVFAYRAGLQTGDLFSASILNSRFELPVIGIVRDYRTKGGVVYYSLNHFRDKTGDAKWGGARIFFKKGNKRLQEAVSDLKNRIVDCCGDAVQVTAGESLRGAILKIFDETFAITSVLLLIALAVAALGISSTLTVTVLERRLELNIMYAVGGSRGQVRAMIFWESFLLVLAGGLSGLLCGFVLSYLLVFVINKQSFGWTFFYSVDFPTLAMSCPLIFLTAIAAAVPALKTAFRQPPATLLKER